MKINLREKRKGVQMGKSCDGKKERVRKSKKTFFIEGEGPKGILRVIQVIMQRPANLLALMVRKQR